MKKNSLPIKILLFLIKKFPKLKEKYVIDHLIDRYGTHHQRELTGWFGLSKKIKNTDTWEKEFFSVLTNKETQNDWVVALDCHVIPHNNWQLPNRISIANYLERVR